MEKLPMCRICLAKNVPMYVVVNKNLHELYKKLTDVPFVTEDSRPMVACYICCVKLKQCCRLMMKCLEAEELFAKMTSVDYELNPSVKQANLQFFGGLVKTSLQSISIVDVGLTECVIVKEELPAVCENRDDIIEQTEEHQCDDIKRENRDIRCSDKKNLSFPSIQFEEDSADDVPLMEFKTEVVEEQEVSEQKQRAMESNNIKQENRNLGCSDKEDISFPSIIFEEDSEDDVRLMEIKTEAVEEQEVFEQKQRAKEMNSPAVAEEPKLHLRRTKLENSIPVDQKTNQITGSKIIRAVRNRTSKPVTKFKKLHECEICHYKFSNKRDLTNHIRTHTGKKPYKCVMCQNSYMHKISLTNHIRTHTGEKPYECDICHRSFSQKTLLTDHVRTHTGEKPHKCEICLSSFSRKRTLTIHIRTHTGEKPYNCNICQSSYRHKISLTKHIRTHTGEKPYKCDICQISFSRKGTLTDHIRIHTGEKRYKCDICQCSFIQKYSLTSHIRTHTGEKPYKCDKCQSSFSEKGSLIKHIRTHTC